MTNLLKKREEVGDNREDINELKMVHHMELEQIDKSVEQMKRGHMEEVARTLCYCEMTLMVG